MQGLVNRKYSIGDLIDLEELRKIFESFTLATGFTIGFLEHPTLKLLITTGWRDICTKFHRACPESLSHCLESNKKLIGQLKEMGQLVIEECENGLVDCATPIIINGKHIATLATGQVLLKKPNIKRFNKQAQTYGYDADRYLAALSQVHVVSEENLKKVATFLCNIAVLIAELGIKSLENKRKAVRAEEVRNRLFNFSGDMMCIAGFDGYFKEVNPAWEKTLGWTKKELMAKPFFDLVHPDDRESTIAAAKRLEEERTTVAFENRYQCKNGIYKWFSWNSCLLAEEHVSFAVARDITERKRMETEREKLIVELQEALAQVKQLSGLLPICASCKKIRNDKGFWEQVETYITKHSQALFSHAICPDCGKKLYPEYYDKIWGGKDK